MEVAVIEPGKVEVWAVGDDFKSKAMGSDLEYLHFAVCRQ
jgi:hypothetical protein